MKPRGWLALLVLATGATCPTRAAETSDLIMDLFLQKGMVTSEEAARIKAEAERLRTNAPPRELPPVDSKWKISKGNKSIELFGDVRLRYESRDAKDPMGGEIDLERYRYSARIGIRGELFDDFYYGVRLDPSANPRSPWLTFGSNSSSGTYSGPFGKSTASLNLGQVYMGWRGVDWAEITVGKMPNPLYTTSMVWDGDLNPEGAAEKFKYTIGDADFFLTMGQFLYQDTNPNEASKGFFNLDYNTSHPAFLLTWQLGVNYHLTKNLTIKAAPTYYHYNGHGSDLAPGSPEFPGFNGSYIGQGSTNGVLGGSASWSGYPGGAYDGFVANQTGIRDLRIIEFPVEVNYKTRFADYRLFGDYANNLSGAERAKHAYTAQFDPLLATAGLAPIPDAQTAENNAYTVGISVGSPDTIGLITGAVTKRHGWEVRTYWQHIEQYALDPNLLDSDYFEGRANLEGIFAAAAFGLTDNLTAIFRYGHANRINKLLGTGGSNLDIPQMNPIDRYDIFQIDLALKF